MLLQALLLRRHEGGPRGLIYFEDVSDRALSGLSAHLR